MALKLNIAHKDRIMVPYKNGDGEVLAKFFIEPLTPSEFKNLAKMCEEVVWDSPNKKAKKERFVDYDFVKLAFERIDKIIVDWEDVQDADGNDLECTRENKRLVYELHTDVMNYVIEEHDKIVDAMAKNQDDEVKN